MKKRVLSVLLVALLLTAVVTTSAAAAGLSNFTKVNTYADGQFTDVPADAWYAPNVRLAYEYDLIDGMTDSTFEPGSNLTIGQAIKLAVCLNSIYETGSVTLTNGEPWYQPYVDYALQNGIISSGYSNYNAPTTRAEFAVIFAGTMPAEALAPINTVKDGAIPDVQSGFSYAPAVYLLYRAGVLTGNDSYGTFYPNNNIQRAEVAAIVTRMANASFRKTLTLGVELTAEQVSAKCSPAVFYIEVYDAGGRALGSGSGFFISEGGRAVTNCHVIDGASSAKIQTTDGSWYNVRGVYDYSEDKDLALLQIDGSGFPYLNMADSSVVRSGQTIYAIGSPRGLDNTFSSGIISNTARTIGSLTYIQITAPISPGSSGGALVDAYGNVIGVTSAYIEGGQNLNLAIPINLVSILNDSNHVPLSSISWGSGLIAFSATSVTVNVGGTATVTVTDVKDNCYSSAYSIADKSIVSCSWNSWVGNKCGLNIKGLNAGTTTVSVALLDERDNVLASGNITVTVTETSSVVYYPGYEPVPDFGAYSGLPLYTKTPRSNGSTEFTYDASKIPNSQLESILSGYLDLLAQNGFIYYGEYEADNDYALIYYNDQWDVYFGVMLVGSVVCLYVDIYPA